MNFWYDNWFWGITATKLSALNQIQKKNEAAKNYPIHY